MRDAATRLKDARGLRNEYSFNIKLNSRRRATRSLTCAYVDHLIINYQQCHQHINTLLPSFVRTHLKKCGTRRLIKQFMLSRCQPVINIFNIQLMPFSQFNGTFNTTIANIFVRLLTIPMSSLRACEFKKQFIHHRKYLLFRTIIFRSES